MTTGLRRVAGPLPENQPETALEYGRDVERLAVLANRLFLPLDGAARSRVMATDHSGKADAGVPRTSTRRPVVRA